MHPEGRGDNSQPKNFNIETASERDEFPGAAHAALFFRPFLPE
jgi:hypothetical protein